jgi:hypothetical protein
MSIAAVPTKSEEAAPTSKQELAILKKVKGLGFSEDN